MMSVRLFSRKDITLENLRRVAWAGETVEIDGSAVARMEAARRRFMTLLEDPAISVYGVTSGYGQNAKKRLTDDERK
ncbi:MAG: aromatic amino acid lyase, partial [Aestuariivirga sp.]